MPTLQFEESLAKQQGVENVTHTGHVQSFLHMVFCLRSWPELGGTASDDH